MEDHRQAWQCCKILNIVSIFLIAMTINPYTSNSINVLLYFVSTFIQNGVTIQTSMSFVFLIRTLHTRFAALNRFFRYFHQYFPFNEVFFFNHLCFVICNRCQFFKGNLVKVKSFDVHKIDSINVIKMIGCQHKFLVEVMDQINMCYSLQMMVISWFTFVTILFTLYSVFRYILHRDDFFLTKFLLHIEWLLFFLSILIAVIFWSHLLSKKV